MKASDLETAVEPLFALTTQRSVATAPLDTDPGEQEESIATKYLQQALLNGVKEGDETVEGENLLRVEALKVKLALDGLNEAIEILPAQPSPSVTWRSRCRYPATGCRKTRPSCPLYLQTTSSTTPTAKATTPLRW